MLGRGALLLLSLLSQLLIMLLDLFEQLKVLDVFELTLRVEIEYRFLRLLLLLFRSVFVLL